MPDNSGPHLVRDDESIAIMWYYGAHKGQHEWRTWAKHPYHEVIDPTHWMGIELPIVFQTLDWKDVND